MFASLLRFRPGFRAGSKFSTRRPRTRLQLEELETRTVPSVVVGQTGATLNITDNDTSGHTINVNQTATQGTFTVQVDSGPTSTFTGISNIKANLGADNATLLLNSDGFTTNLSGNLTVTAADGNNSVSENLNAIQGNVSVTEGNGSDSVDASNTAINGNLSVTQGVGSQDQVNLGVNFANLNGATFSGATTIGGNLSVSQGDGNADEVNFGVNFGTVYYFSSFASETTIGGNLSLTQGNGAQDEISFNDASVAGNASFQLGNGTNDTVNIEAFSPDNQGVTFSKNVSIRFGSGGSAVLNIGTDGALVTFDADASFSAGGSGNTYAQGADVSFQPGQPKASNF